MNNNFYKIKDYFNLIAYCVITFQMLSGKEDKKFNRLQKNFQFTKIHYRCKL